MKAALVKVSLGSILGIRSQKSANLIPEGFGACVVQERTHRSGTVYIRIKSLKENKAKTHNDNLRRVQGLEVFTELLQSVPKSYSMEAPLPDR